MRNAFLEELRNLAVTNPDIFLVVGDLGFSVVEPFAEAFPDRYLNAGIAEQNMTGLAAGLAFTGYNVFNYSIANFPTLRCLEQIRNDICYHKANVKIVSVGAGLAYGSLGYSHHAVQDIACLRGFPGIVMATPGDPSEARVATRFLCSYNGPAYLRLGKAGETHVHDCTDTIPTYPWFPISENAGAETSILACGSVLALAQPVAVETKSELVSAVLWGDDEPTRDALVGYVRNHKKVVVIEEHLRAGGFASFVRECLENEPILQSRILCLSVNASACGAVGSQNYLRGVGGVTAENLSSLVLSH